MPTAKLSDDNKYYCVAIPQATFWLSVEKIAGPIPAPAKHATMSSYVAYTDGPGREYFRGCLPFQYWNLDVAKKQQMTISSSNPLYLDYLEAAGVFRK